MFWKTENASAFRAMHGFESGPDWQTPECPLWDLVRGFLKAAKILPLNNPDGGASDESIQVVGGVNRAVLTRLLTTLSFLPTNYENGESHPGH
jgi:hypothetical protein